MDSLQPESPDPSLSPTSAPAVVQSSYRDRHTLLKIFGVVQITFGVLAAFGIPLALLGALMSRKMGGATAPMGTYLNGCLHYAAIAILLITLGAGTMQARRWAWALTLILSWLWLVFGIMATILMTAVLPGAFAAAFRRAASLHSNAPPLPTVVTAVILTFMIVFCGLFLIATPLIFVVFYRRKDVQETVKRRDPVERWTDRCPLPVLAASMVFVGGALYYLSMSFTTPITQFFGKYLTGIPGAIGCVVHALIGVLLAVLFFRRMLAGWWTALALLIVQALSTILTFTHGNLLEAYSHLGWKGEQLDALSENPIFRGHLIMWWNLMFFVIYLGYLLWIKRYFTSPPVNTDPPITAPASM